MDGTNAEALNKLVADFNTSQQGQDRGQGDLPGQLRRHDHQVQGRDPEQVDARRRPDLRHRHALHDRRQADRADAGVHRPRQARRRRDLAAQHHQLLLDRRQAELDAVQHLDAAALLSTRRVREGRPRPDEAADRTSTRSRAAAEKLVEEERRPGRLRLRRRDLRLAARAVHRHRRQGVLRPGQRPQRQATKVQLRLGRQRQGRRRGGRRWSRTACAANTGRDTKDAQAAFKSGQLAMQPGVHRPAAAATRRRQGRLAGSSAPRLPARQRRHDRRPDHRRRLAVDQRRRPQGRQEGGRLAVREVPGRAREPGHMAHRHRLLPDQRQGRARRAGRRGLPQGQYPLFDVAVKQLERHRAQHGHPGLPARRHAPGPQGLRGRSRGGAQRRRPAARR